MAGKDFGVSHKNERGVGLQWEVWSPKKNLSYEMFGTPMNIFESAMKSWGFRWIIESMASPTVYGPQITIITL